MKITSKELKNRTEWHTKDGKLHRLDGPAVEYTNGNKEWWINGVEYSKEDFLVHTRSKFTSSLSLHQKLGLALGVTFDENSFKESEVIFDCIIDMSTCEVNLENEDIFEVVLSTTAIKIYKDGGIIYNNGDFFTQGEFKDATIDAIEVFYGKFHPINKLEKMLLHFSENVDAEFVKNLTLVYEEYNKRKSFIGSKPLTLDDIKRIIGK